MTEHPNAAHDTGRSTTPYVTLSTAVSLDGYLDTSGPSRLTLSNDADLDRVDELRAGSDAILVGARTVRRDNPRLLVKSSARQAQRESDGRERSPWKVTVTATGDLDPHAAFFTEGDGTKLVYCFTAEAERIRRRIGHAALVVGLGNASQGSLSQGSTSQGRLSQGSNLAMADLLADLADRGVRELMVEGGGTVHTQFLAGNLVDELHLAVAPFFVGEPTAPRFVGDAAFPWTSDRRVKLAEVRQVGDMVVMRYALSDRFAEHEANNQRSAKRGQLKENP